MTADLAESATTPLVNRLLERLRRETRLIVACYHCKSSLFDALFPLAELFNAPVAVGTNLDDLGDYRPGQRGRC